MADDKRVIEAATKLAADCGDASRASDMTGFFSERDIGAGRRAIARAAERRDDDEVTHES